jgi:hypothetical protein
LSNTWIKFWNTLASVFTVSAFVDNKVQTLFVAGQLLYSVFAQLNQTGHLFVNVWFPRHRRAIQPVYIIDPFSVSGVLHFRWPWSLPGGSPLDFTFKLYIVDTHKLFKIGNLPTNCKKINKKNISLL